MTQIRKPVGDGRTPGFFPRPLWLDENLDLLSLKVPSQNNLPIAVLASGTSIPYPGFPNNVLTEFYGHKEYNHNSAVYPRYPAQIRPHFHYAVTTTDIADFKIFFEYQIVSGAIAITGLQSVVITTQGDTWIERRSEIGSPIVFPAGIREEVGCQIGFRFYRDPSDVEDTYAGTVVMYTAGWHYPSDSQGSRGIFAKYG